jgi:5-methylcytosine-specific restriction enzyme subunit McrC
MTSRVVELAEYEEAEVAISPHAERVLRRVAGHRLTSRPANEGTFAIRASSHVGAITTPEVTVIIRPKVDTDIVLYLLEADGQALRLDSADVELLSSRDLVPGVATLFAKQLERLVGAGVVRGYRRTEENLSTIRGRIDITRQSNRGGVAIPVQCVYDDFVTDIRLNRRVRGAALRLLQLPGLAAKTTVRLRRMLAAFDQVGDITPADLVLPSRFTRLDEHYRTIDALATIVLRHASLQLRGGPTKVSAFTIDMDSVFESFVAARLRRLLAGRSVIEAKGVQPLDLHRHRRIFPDLVFATPGGPARYVADTKYKLTSHGFARDTDYYQLLAYTTALDLPEGLLIYAAGEETLPREILVGRSETRLRSYSLRLTGRPPDIDRRMRELAGLITSRMTGIAT